MNKDILKFITCGSVDDGKSTLVGRLLYDADLLTKDQLDSLLKDSKNSSSKNNPENLDFSLLTDGLQAEQEQGITIDVSYRFFETNKRKFIIADCPGHVQYTRNMATAASNTEVAIILIDARHGIIEQTKRHFFINYLLGIKNYIIVVNKMDLIKFDEQRFLEIKKDFKAFCEKQVKEREISFNFLPISATNGDNIVKKSNKTSYYKNKTLLEILEDIDIDKTSKKNDFVLGIKLVVRPNSNFRGYKGKISSGTISVGEKVRIFGKRTSSEIKEIFINDENVKLAKTGDIVCITLKDELDISSGDFLTSFSSNLSNSTNFNADIIWLDHEELNQEKDYIIKFYNNECFVTNIEPKFIYNISSLKEENFKNFKLNTIGNFDLEISNNIALSNYEMNQELGSFIIIDKISNFTVGAGMIGNSNISSAKAPISENISLSKIDITHSDRAKMKDQKPCCIWLTGLSGSGKSTIANLLDKTLYNDNKHSFILDGDNMRFGLNSDLGFSREDRHENIRRIGHVCKLMVDSGLIVISAFISPDSKTRDFVKNNIFKNKNFVEIYVKADIETCKKRDPKKLYEKALSGEIKNFTGIDAPYDIPQNPDIVIDTKNNSPEESVLQIMKELKHYF